MNASRPQAVIWLASYPRSGNTFLRTLIANYFSGLERPLSLEELMLSTWGEHVEDIWQGITGKNPVQRSHTDEFYARPAYFAQLRARIPNPLRLVKTHTPYVNMDGKPAFSFVPGDRLIHVIRHPCDVAISFAHYFGIGLDEAIRRLTTRDTCHTGHPQMGHELIGSWSQHARSWMGMREIPGFGIRYVDLATRTAPVLADIVRFLGHQPVPARIDTAIGFSRFERLRAQEDAAGFIENAGRGGQSFFREGRPGQWQEVLSPAQAQRLFDADPELIDRFAFATDLAA
ncbi:MAG TPA: sulfotransferase domain-containing protein [Novosphingobium sp.]|nr:sulfotransferase domain-containing protein [Novosphingobium sp.]